MNGAFVWSAKYESFGKADVDITSTITNNLRFPGQFYDEETDLHYNFFRYYAPRSGRYLRVDPMGLDGGINVFSYSENNPANLIDATGLWSVGFGVYYGPGGDVSITSTTCCKNNTLMNVKYFTFCFGVGIGGRIKGKSIPIGLSSPPTKGISSYGNTCPKTGDMFLAKSATVAVVVGGTGTAQAGNRGLGAEASLVVGFGASYEILKICAIIVWDEDHAANECPCIEEGKRFTDLPWQ